MNPRELCQKRGKLETNIRLDARVEMTMKCMTRSMVLTHVLRPDNQERTLNANRVSRFSIRKRLRKIFGCCTGHWNPCKNSFPWITVPYRGNWLFLEAKLPTLQFRNQIQGLEYHNWDCLGSSSFLRIGSISVKNLLSILDCYEFFKWQEIDMSPIFERKFLFFKAFLLTFGK